MRTLLTLIVLSLLTTARAEEWTPLLDQDLSKFEIWMGIPHASVEGLPAGTYQSDNVHKGTPMGLDSDVKNVFKMIEEAGQPVLHISGEIYGGLTTLAEYENYHLQVMVKWGDKKWPPRETVLRDSGILYHCHGEHGRFWNVWKACLECQVQESDLGDFIALGGTSGKVRASTVEGTKRKRFDPASTELTGGYISAWPEPDNAHGEWNVIDVYTVGDQSAHYANGKLVMVVQNARDANGKPLTKGQIQLQSEAAECFYKGMKIRTITELPQDAAALIQP